MSAPTVTAPTLTATESAPLAELPPQPAPGFFEFVGLIASLIALGALGVDAMLPALPAMAVSYGVQNPNSLQWLIAAYFLGTGVGQLIFGSLSDWLGRKRVLMVGIAVYVVLMLIAPLAPNLAVLIVLRALQGCAASSANVVTRSIVRDLYEGPRMAKVMSISFMIFLAVPILAPSFGQVVLLVLPWQAIFLIIATAGIGVLTWAWLRLPETLAPRLRFRPDLAHLKRVAVAVLAEPSSLFYSLAVTFLIASLLTYVSLMPQIFAVAFARPTLMAPVFAACAATMGGGALLNASLVERLGSRRISHIALCTLVGLTAIHFLWAWSGHESIISFVILQALTMGCFSLTTSNFSAIAMEKVGHVAGTAASIQGVVTSVGGSLIGGYVGQHWDGHVALLPFGACLCAIAALALVAFGEKGRLFTKLNPPA